MALRRKNAADPLLSLYLQEMIGAIQQIFEYTANATFDQFVNQKMLHDAVLRQFEILGEASGHVAYAVQKKNKHIPWAMMYSLRNHIAHEYFDADVEIIWEIIQHDLKTNLADLIKLKAGLSTH